LFRKMFLCQVYPSIYDGNLIQNIMVNQGLYMDLSM
jgi:hypothetical protein